MNSIENTQGFKAFISCSLREQDRSFIEFVSKIVNRFGFIPFGTIGKYSAAPINPAEHMRLNIPQADIVVIAATSRYEQRDVHTEQISNGLSEMIHVETGMAFMTGKPVIVFVQEGSHVGNFLPNITEYITLNGTNNDLEKKWQLIASLMQHAYVAVQRGKAKNSSDEAMDFLKGGLAVVGVVALADALFYEEEKPTKRYKKRRNYY